MSTLSNDYDKTQLYVNHTNNTVDKNVLNDERYIFGNLFGIIPDKYIKYFNLFLIHLVSTVFFGIIYYILLLDFNTYWFFPGELQKNQLFDHLGLAAFFLSIQFETTTAYVDLKCKHILPRCIINLQIIITFMITFLFLTV
jgi:hypothetical protein